MSNFPPICAIPLHYVYFLAFYGLFFDFLIMKYLLNFVDILEVWKWKINGRLMEEWSFYCGKEYYSFQLDIWFTRYLVQQMS